MSLFVAVDVPADVRRQVLAALRRVQHLAPQLRYTAEASWHVTLAFLGPVPAAESVAVVDALAAVAAASRSFTVRLDGGAGTFGRRVLWAGFAPEPALTDLAVTVRTATGAADAAPFTAHLTLARVPRRGGRVPSEVVEAYEGPRTCWRVEHLQLLSSVGRARGGPYPVVARWPLAG